MWWDSIDKALIKNRERFCRECSAIPARPTEYEIEVHCVACLYLAETELYDRSLPGSKWEKGEPCFVYPPYQHNSKLFAARLRKELSLRTHIPWSDIHDYIRKVHRPIDWWIDQWELLKQSEENITTSIEIKYEEDDT